MECFYNFYKIVLVMETMLIAITRWDDFAVPHLGLWGREAVASS